MVSLDNINKAAQNLQGVSLHTPLQYNLQLSEEFGCNVYLKREDLQTVRSYKIRGAYNKISSLSETEKQKGEPIFEVGTTHFKPFLFSKTNFLSTTEKIQNSPIES